MEGTSLGSIRKVGGGYCGVSDSGRELHEGVSDRRGDLFESIRYVDGNSMSCNRWR